MNQRLCTVHSDCMAAGAVMRAACWKTQWAALPDDLRHKVIDFVERDGLLPGDRFLDAVAAKHPALAQPYRQAEADFLRGLALEYREAMEEELLARVFVRALAHVLALVGHDSWYTMDELAALWDRRAVAAEVGAGVGELARMPRVTTGLGTTAFRFPTVTIQPNSTTDVFWTAQEPVRPKCVVVEESVAHLLTVVFRVGVRHQFELPGFMLTLNGMGMAGDYDYAMTAYTLTLRLTNHSPEPVTVQSAVVAHRFTEARTIGTRLR